MVFSKYNVSKDTAKRTFDGIVFASQMEMQYYRDVVLPLSRSGEIVHYELQKKYELQPKFVHDDRMIRPITYVADFFIEYADGRTVVVDTKGCADAKARIKRKMFWYVYPDIEYKWITHVKKYGGWVDYDYLNKIRRAEKAHKAKKEEGTENED